VGCTKTAVLLKVSGALSGKPLFYVSCLCERAIMKTAAFPEPACAASGSRERFAPLLSCGLHKMRNSVPCKSPSREVGAQAAKALPLFIRKTQSVTQCMQNRCGFNSFGPTVGNVWPIETAVSVPTPSAGRHARPLRARHHGLLRCSPRSVRSHSEIHRTDSEFVCVQVQ